jgi:hypothetical protein
VPSVPQLVAPLSAQWSSGSAPAGTGVHVPSVPVSAQDRQVPVQLEPQQMPCWHSPDAHSPPPLQAAPSGLSEQRPPMQMLGATQSALEVQLTRQFPAVPQL